MSENGPRGKGDDRRSGRPDRRDHGSREGNKKFGERRGAPGRNGKFERDRRGRDGRDRDSFERRGARRQYDDRPGRKRDERRDDFRRGDRRSFDRRDERRGPDKRRDEHGQRSAQGRPSRNGGTRPPKRDDVAARELLSAPELPDSVSFSDLDIEARRELRSLPKDLAERVGRHLVAAGMLLDEDPEAALAHARYAKAKASRIAVVREAVGLAAYHAGEWAEALSELRAVRRMTRTDIHVAVIADAERALGRPERALDVAKETDTSALPKEIEVELRIVAAGARRDLGQLDAAVVSLQGTDLDPRRREPWSHRLFYAYADNLAAAGRTEEAVRWFLHAAEADLEEETDAAERAAELTS